MATRYLPDGCRFGCAAGDPCRCAVIEGLVWFTRVIITGLSLAVSATGHVSADALGHRAAEGPGAGMTSPRGGGGGGGGGNGAAACQAGAGAGGSAYGLAIAPSDMGYCAGGGAQASIDQHSCAHRAAWELGSGGGHGLVQGGQGGGAVRIHTDVEVVVDGAITARGEDSACVDVVVEDTVPAVRPGPSGMPAEAPMLVQRRQFTVSQPGGGGGGGGTIWITSPRIVGAGVVSAAGGSANRSCDIVRVVSSGGSGGGGRVALDYATSSTASLRVNVRGGLSRCTAGGGGTVFHSLLRTLIVDNGTPIPMAGQPGNFGAFPEPPVLVSAYTPWTSVGPAVQAQRLRACAYNPNYAQPFGCDRAGLNFSAVNLMVRNGAVAEFPLDVVANVVVESGGVLIPTANSSACSAQGNVTVRTGGVLGCLSCAGSREAANDVAGCQDTCPSWNLTASRGGLVVDEGGKVMGLAASLSLGLSAMFGPDSWVAASDWQGFPQFSLVAAGNVTVAGRIWMSSVYMSAAHIFVRNGGWIGSDALGYFSDTGPGAGSATSAGGGGGGGHGGAGAQGCYDFAAGGAGYGDGADPHTFGSGGGTGGSRALQQPLSTASPSGPARQRPAPSAALPPNATVRQLVRDRYQVRVTADLCMLRGSRNVQLGPHGEVVGAVPLSSHGTACPSGYQGSSLPDWCCHGVACDCGIGFINFHPGGRGGGKISLFATNTLVNDGVITSNGEGAGCQGAVGTPVRSSPSGQDFALPESVAFATGGGGAGGSILASAFTIEGAGSFQARGGTVSANCSMTKSGGGGGGGRIVLSYQSIGMYIQAEASGGYSDGCASGGAGTIYYSLNKTLVVDNQDPSFISAITPFPMTVIQVDTTIISTRGAILEFPQGRVGRAYAVNGGALIATMISNCLTVGSLIVARNGILGCLDCVIAADAQNSLPGCNGTAFSPCPSYLVIATEITFTKSGKLRGYFVDIESDGFVSIDRHCTWITSDPTADSRLHVNASFFRTQGHLRFSTIQITGSNVYVGPYGWISSNALGFIGGHGPAAGAGYQSGGGGGGNGGSGAQGCSLESDGGHSVWNGLDTVTSPWTFGSGGGQGGGNSASGGGRGGGRIRVAITGNFTLLGMVSADGASTRCIGVSKSYYIRNRADKQFIAGSHGGGAGAGGSVWVLAAFIFGDGAIFARGGSSYCASHLAWPGGGGGGGRIAIIAATTRLLSLELNASGGKSGWDIEQADKSGTGRIRGCAAGGAGTIFIRGGSFDTLIVDNGMKGRLSALTPFPIYSRMDKVVVRRGAIVQFPLEAANMSVAAAATAGLSSTNGKSVSSTSASSVTSYPSFMSSTSTLARSTTGTTTILITTTTAVSSITLRVTSSSSAPYFFNVSTGTATLNMTSNFSYSSTVTNLTQQLSTYPADANGSSVMKVTTSTLSSAPAFTTAALTSTVSPVVTSSTVGMTVSVKMSAIATTATTSAPAVTAPSTAASAASTGGLPTIAARALSGSGPPIINQIVVDEAAALVAVPGAQILVAQDVLIDRGGIIGCLSCADSISAQNQVPGCSNSCPPFKVQCLSLQTLQKGRVMGVEIELSISGILNIQNNSGLVASDLAASSQLNATVGKMDVDGFVRFASVNISVQTDGVIRSSGRISSNSLGSPSDDGPGAGISSNLGGGGGGHGGSGDNGCQRTPTGAFSGLGGQPYSDPEVPVASSWLVGSGGGHGDALTWNATVPWNDYQQLLSYPSGGYIACAFDRGCDDLEDAAHKDLGRQPEYLPTFETRRRYFDGSYTVQNADALCWPRGISVDYWASSTVLTSALVPSHPKACPPGWSGSNIEGFCCQGKLAALHSEHFDWSTRLDCDCSDFATGQNPGGQGGGRIKLAVGNLLSIEGSISADGESTACSGSASHPGGAGSGGTVHVSAPIMQGNGSITARGGVGRSDCAATFAGGGGGGGYVALEYGISSALDVSVSGGSTDCTDGRIGRFCDPVNVGDCNFTVLNDEFDSIYLGHPFWKWDNEPPRTCFQGGESDANINPQNQEIVANFSSRQGKCWDVSVTRLGWLRVVPSNLIDQWLDDTAHRLYVSLPSHTPFDVSTHIQVTNNDSSCVMAGLFARGVVSSLMSDCAQCNASAPPGTHCSTCWALDWVTVGVLDSGEGSRLQWSTRGTTMQDVYGMRDRKRVTDVRLRLVRDGNSTFRAYWKKLEEDEWTPFALSQAWALDTLEVGLYVAQCEEYGNATADFEYFRDGTATALDKTFGWKGESGTLFERGAPLSVPGVGGNVTYYETVAGFEGAASAAAQANRSLVAFQLNSSRYSLAGLRMPVQYVLLRGGASIPFPQLWRATSSARFVTSQRYVENFGDLRDTEAWNGTAWTPMVTEFVVTVRLSAYRLRYTFFVDGVEAPTLTIYRPGVYERPFLYIFTLDPASFNASAPLPPLNATRNGSLPAPLDGSGAASPHPFLITTAPDGGFGSAYRVGLRRNGARGGEVQMRVAASAPDTLYYCSGTTPGMGGVISVQDPLLAHANLLPDRRRRLLAQGGMPTSARRQPPRIGLRERLRQFYRVHNAGKLAHLGDMVREWEGREGELNALLRARYGADLDSFERERRARRSDWVSDGGPDEGLFLAAEEDVPLLNGTAADNETTVLGLAPAAAVIDCGGGSLFQPASPGGPPGPALLLVDVDLELRRCNFSGAVSGGGYAVVAHHSAVRFTDCTFAGDGSGHGGGGLDVDASFVDLRGARFAGIGGGGAGGAARVGARLVRLAGVPRAGGSPAGIHRLGAQAYMARAAFEGCAADSGGAVWAAGGTWYCSDCDFRGNRARLSAGALQVCVVPRVRVLAPGAGGRALRRVGSEAIEGESFQAGFGLLAGSFGDVLHGKIKWKGGMSLLVAIQCSQRTRFGSLAVQGRWRSGTLFCLSLRLLCVHAARRCLARVRPSSRAAASPAIGRARAARCTCAAAPPPSPDAPSTATRPGSTAAWACSDPTAPLTRCSRRRPSPGRPARPPARRSRRTRCSRRRGRRRFCTARLGATGQWDRRWTPALAGRSTWTGQGRGRCERVSFVSHERVVHCLPAGQGARLCS